MGLLDETGRRELVIMTAGFTGGLLVALGISRLTSRSKGRTDKPMKLYHTHTFKSSRVKWAIHELGLQSHCEIENYNPHTATEEQKSWYRNHAHPNNLLPVLQLPSDHLMYEGAAICFYLAQREQRLLPPAECLHHYYSWSVYALSALEPWVQTLLVQRFLTKESRKDRPLQRQTSKLLLEGMGALNTHLQQREYICGDVFTIADTIVGYTVLFAFVINGGQVFADLPHVRRYLETLRERPCFEECVGTQEDWMASVESLRTLLNIDS